MAMTRNIMLAALTFMAAIVPETARASGNCQKFKEWNLRGDALNENGYQNQQGSRLLLEYTTSADDDRYLYYSYVNVEKGIYNIDVSIETGESPSDFTISVENANDSATGRPVSLQVAERVAVVFKRRLIVSEGASVVTLKIRSPTPDPAKVWSFVDAATLCKADDN